VLIAAIAVCLALGVGAALLGLSIGDPAAALQLVGWSVVVGGLMLTLANRYALQVTEAPADLEQYLLYLRPFRGETRADFTIPESEAEFQLREGAPARGALDEFLEQEAVRRIGPVLGLGRPQDVGARPGGFRIYLTHEDWQPELRRLAEGATAIVMVPGHSAALSWELEFLTQARLLGKLFVVTSPSSADGNGGWELFAQDLAAAGIRMDIDDPGPYAVVGFTPDATATVLVEHVRTAADVIDAVDDWLPGRWYNDAPPPDPGARDPDRGDGTPTPTTTPVTQSRRKSTDRPRDLPARSANGELTGVTVRRPARPWVVLPVLVTMVVATGVVCWRDPALLKPGLGLVIAAVLIGVVVVPLTILFMVLLYQHVHHPEIDALVRHDFPAWSKRCGTATSTCATAHAPRCAPAPTSTPQSR
jgi:hypothetical protein